MEVQIEASLAFSGIENGVKILLNDPPTSRSTKTFLLADCGTCLVVYIGCFQYVRDSNVAFCSEDSLVVGLRT